ncbi:flagellar biosynthesis anti-sigma factor FlgM [Sansalvadorimonas verongulae]|uniref:flagellar biosynthesis anti-sigma factor FlgM n=1 Tax=Sansalvadorimonas verongulae TaxID=2172824 RepID=UPI0012BBA14A|nr:flagellar biosynthesis anti-sigma factor FlgM [Sansalvadorimonas verongulae]MTI13474.1 flagellar biosynthesis anti-sigma factor FlgM [Sansalvadorimonas verongulae]
MNELNSHYPLSPVGHSPKGNNKSASFGADMGDSDRIRSRTGPAAIPRKSVAGAATKSAPSAPSSSNSNSSDKVELSTGARLLEALGGELEALQDVDLAKVEEVQEAIRQGKMPVNHEQLANRMQGLFNQLPVDKDRS